MTVLFLSIFIYLIILSALLTVALTWLILKKLRINYERKYWRKRRKRFKREVESYLNSPTAIVPRMRSVLRGNFRHWVLNQLIKYETKLTDKGVVRLSALMDEWGITRDINVGLQSSHWWKRYEALYLAAAFQVKKERRQVIELCMDENPLIRMAAITTLSSIGTEDDIFEIFQVLEQYPTEYYQLDWVLHNLENLQVTHNKKLFERVLRDYKHYKKTFTRRCILEYIGRKNRSECIPFLIDVMRQEEGEVKVGAIKALIELRAKAATPDFVHLVEDTSELAGIQILSMKGLALLGEDNLTECFEENLGHHQWWVRYYSALGLFKLGKAGRYELQRIEQEHPDKYARDMSRYYLDMIKLGGFGNYVHS